MKLEEFTRRIRLPVPVETAFTWHERPGAFARLIPPWQSVQFVNSEGGIRDGGFVEFRVKTGPVWRRWRAEHRDYDPPKQFRDVQLAGPFSYWDHLHRFEPEGPNACSLEDRIEYRPPGGLLGSVLGGDCLRRELERMFRYRHDTTAADLAAHAEFADRPRLRVAVSGSSGLVGSSLRAFLTTGGHEVQRLSRGADNRIEAGPAEGCDAVVHLAGENIAGGRWNESKKRRIHDSRVDMTRELCRSLAAMDQPPRVLVSASAIGYYGDRGDEVLDETKPPGDGFLADVCREWEAAAQPAVEAGIRVVHARFGIILSPAGGSLAKMLTPFRFGLGGKLGSGRQYVSWISIDDAVAAIQQAIMNETLSGPVNFTAPHPVTNAELTSTLGRVLRRPTIASVPRPAARLVFGEMADELFLSSARVVPEKLAANGYAFRQEHLEAALRHLLGRQLN